MLFLWHLEEPVQVMWIPLLPCLGPHMSTSWGHQLWTKMGKGTSRSRYLIRHDAGVRFEQQPGFLKISLCTEIHSIFLLTVKV